MSSKRLATLLVALPAIVFFSACSGTSNNTDGGTDAGTQDAGTQDAGTQDAGTSCVTQTPINIDGTLAIHPVSLQLAQATSTTVTLDNTTLAMARASGLLSGNSPILTYSDAACTPVMGDVTPSSTDPTTATFSYQNVNADNVVLGLIAVADNKTGNSTFINTATGIAAPPFSNNAVSGASAFAVTAATEGALATLDGKQPGDLLTGGFILGMFIDSSGNPIQGVTLTDTSGTAISEAFYPTADFSGLTTTGATSANGVFVVSNVSLADYTGQKTGMTFTDQQAATIANSCFVMFLTGQ
jgi:hypothetical protein